MSNDVLSSRIALTGCFKIPAYAGIQREASGIQRWSCGRDEEAGRSEADPVSRVSRATG
jgi:hypothetical protein